MENSYFVSYGGPDPPTKVNW